jgi:hypothetical protein
MLKLKDVFKFNNNNVSNKWSINENYTDWDENGPIKNIGIYHRVYKIESSGEIIDLDLNNLIEPNKDYRLKFKYYIEPEALFNDTNGYVQEIKMHGELAE